MPKAPKGCCWLAAAKAVVLLLVAPVGGFQWSVWPWQRGNDEGATNGVINVKTPTAPGKIRLEVYYESLCPASMEFFLFDLRSIWADPELREIIDVNPHPFGIASIDGNGEMHCQHGEEECFGNKIQSCALSLFPNKSEAIDFILCAMPEFTRIGVQDAFMGCAETFDQYVKIGKCTDNDEGKQIMLGMSRAKPKVSMGYVPWVVSDDAHVAHGEDLIAFICRQAWEKYDGHVPKKCINNGVDHSKTLSSTLDAKGNRSMPCSINSTNRTSGGANVLKDLSSWGQKGQSVPAEPAAVPKENRAAPCSKGHHC